jgi:hypothetical protein
MTRERAWTKKGATSFHPGMGGSYADGTLLVAIVFTSELIDRLAVSRFPSLISNLKMATAQLMVAGKAFAVPGA